METFKTIADCISFSQEKMRKNGLFQTERLACDLYCFEPGQAQSPHTHQGSDKIYLVLRGKGVFQVGPDEKELAEGEMALAPSGQEHGVRNKGTGQLVLLVFVAPRPAH